jgi:hypothetical protein
VLAVLVAVAICYRLTACCIRRPKPPVWVLHVLVVAAVASLVLFALLVIWTRQAYTSRRDTIVISLAVRDQGFESRRFTRFRRSESSCRDPQLDRIGDPPARR